MTDDERAKQREEMAAQEQAEKEMRAKGVVIPILDGKDMKTVDQIVKLAAIAKKASKQVISVSIFKDGKLQNIEEPVGNEDWIFTELMRQRLNQGEGR